MLLLVIPGTFDLIYLGKRVCNKKFDHGWMTSDFRGQMRLECTRQDAVRLQQPPAPLLDAQATSPSVTFGNHYPLT